MLTNREFHLQTGNLAYKTGFSFTKRESWVTKGILGLLFTPGKNMAVDSGTIEITNKLNEYKLPETGGSGNRWLYMLSGVVLIAIATITLFYKKQKVL